MGSSRFLFLFILLFLLESKGKSQDFSAGVLTEFSENKFVPSVILEKRIRKKNYLQLSLAAGKFSDGYYPDQLPNAARDPLFRERVWDLPYPGSGSYFNPVSNKVVIKGIKVQIGYLEYFPLKSKKHKLFWNFNISIHQLTDTYEAVYPDTTLNGKFKFTSLGTSIRLGYRLVLKHFHFTAFVGPTQYIDLYPAGHNESMIYPIVAPFVDLELEGGLNISYSF